jgi:hypothetical protein
VAGGQAVPGEQRRFVEAAVSTMTAGAPSDWVSLHAEFALADASAIVDTESEAEPVKLPVPPEALRDIALHQQWSVENGRPWRRLIIDYERSGGLSIRTVSVGASMLRRITWALWVLAAVLVIVTLVLFFVR